MIELKTWINKKHKQVLVNDLKIANFEKLQNQSNGKIKFLQFTKRWAAFKMKTQVATEEIFTDFKSV